MKPFQKIYFPTSKIYPALGLTHGILIWSSLFFEKNMMVMSARLYDAVF